jgi:competence protein ComGC
MIAVVIIGLLLAVAIPNFLRARENARTKTCRANLYQIQGAKERWAMDNNQPKEATPTMSDLVDPGVYLKGNPNCPSGGTYDPKRMDEGPTCSIGAAAGSFYAHVMP